MQTKRDATRTIAPTGLLPASDLDGCKVVNPAGEEIGTIEDLMLDLTAGRIRYAVLSFGGFLKMGDKHFAVPPEVFRVDNENETLVLDIDKKRLENAPGFDKNEWPDAADERWQTRVYEHYGFTPYWR